MISVIIPMYNSQDTIERALNSVKAQTAIDQIKEIIVINDGSTDKSLEVVEEYQKANKDLPIKIINKTNGGVSSARNAGLKTAKGDYIALLDSDDEWLPKKTEIQLSYLRANKEIDFIGCNRNNESLKILTRKINKLYKAKVNDLLLKMFPQTSTAIFKREIIKTIGLYDEDQKYLEDGNYWIKICANFNFYFIPDSLVITGGGKPSFGYSGLSANLKQMERGNIKNLKEAKKMNLINTSTYIIFRMFYVVKYIRRIIISFFNKRGK